MKSNFYVSAIYTSPPTTMGGNTKIMLEFIDNLSSQFNFIIFTTEQETFRKHLKNVSQVSIIPIKYPFKKFNYAKHHKEIQYITEIYKEYFEKHTISTKDYFYSCSDFAPDVLPIYALKQNYKFIWIASLFLFIPNPGENIIQHYKFPIVKYIIYYFYQQFLFRKMLQRADLFLITNDYDKKYFPENFRRKIFAIYGGVNPEQIQDVHSNFKRRIMYDAVFCSRLHPQKGLSQLLEVWKEVVNVLPNAKLAIIGNGEKEYEEFLHNKAMRLNLTDNIEWLGYVNGVNKYKVYLKSKMLLHSTVYDNNGMVAAEALCSGIPVIMYDLPQLKKLYTTGCIKVRVAHKDDYAEAIIRLMQSEKYYKSVMPTRKEKSDLQALWNWGYRIKIFNEFLVNRSL